jgi:hypothetical protein
MSTSSSPEVWLRGPLPEVPSLLQPVAHCLLQAQEELTKLMHDFPEALLWKKPAGVAAPGFHLKHIPGVIDRLYTYAKGESLSDEQFSYLKAEETETNSVTELVNVCNDRISLFIEQLKTFNEADLPAKRTVGRAQLPSTVSGLLFHAAEHTMRHLGQLIVTVKVLTSDEKQ